MPRYRRPKFYCKKCGKEITGRGKTGLCGVCLGLGGAALTNWKNSPPKEKCFCKKCGKEIGRKGHTKMCQSCLITKRNTGTHLSEEHKQHIAATVKKLANAGVCGWKLYNNRFGFRDPTPSEEVFAKKNPHLLKQIIFGTGCGGLEKWGAHWFRADFFCPETKTIYEIDGLGHDKLHDQRKDDFFSSLKISVVRIPNAQV
jgi:hypothetical protein